MVGNCTQYHYVGNPIPKSNGKIVRNRMGKICIHLNYVLVGNHTQAHSFRKSPAKLENGRNLQWKYQLRKYDQNNISECSLMKS